MQLPDQVARDIDPAWIEQGETIRVVDEFVVDILMNACGETYESLERFIQIIDIDGLGVTTLDIEGLLRTKQSVRDQDKADKVVLEKALEQMKQSG